MSAFVILMGSEEKRGQTSPTVLEFADDAALREWFASGGGIEATDRWSEQESELFGGWPTVLVLEAGAGEDPIAWMAAEQEAWEDRQDEP